MASARLPVQTVNTTDTSTVLYFDVADWSVCSVQGVGGAGTWTGTMYRTNVTGSNPVALSPAQTITNASLFSNTIDCTGFRQLAFQITSAGSSGTLSLYVSVKG